MHTVTTIGLDIAKSVFQVHGVDAAGQVVIRRQLKRRAQTTGQFNRPPVPTRCCLASVPAGSAALAAIHIELFGFGDARQPRVSRTRALWTPTRRQQRSYRTLIPGKLSSAGWRTRVAQR